jgi:RNA polymerase sigma factor (sigma-70 family)
MTDDGALLREYAQSGSEDAFAELVRRHLDLVYSTALRALNGNQDLAKDVCQSVFIDLVRKAASLSNCSVLTGWLYKSACFAAAKTVRSECRRQVREHQAHVMQEQITSHSQDIVWENISPVFDSVMLELKDSDREALLLRFFERRSLAEVGTKLGLHENAARMRVERALERLRDRLARRGVTSTAAALAILLTHQPVIAAPTGLAASITAGTLAVASNVSVYSILNLIVMSKAKTMLIGAVVASCVATPVILQQHQVNARQSAQIEALRNQLSQASQAQPVTIPAATSELEQLRRDNAELLRLRAEVVSLRQRSASTPKQRKEPNDQLWALKQANEAAEAQALLSKSPEIAMVPAHAWSNVGFATPAAALETLNWAIANRDTNVFGNALVWDTQAKARADALFAAAPEMVRQKYGNVDGVIYDWWLNNSTPVAAARVLSQVEEGASEVTLLEQHIYTDGRVRENTVQFQRDENGVWRQVVPPELMPKLEVVLNNLGATPPVAGK